MVDNTLLQEKAKLLLDSNAKSGDGYYYVAPSKTKYPHQWEWDSAFHSIVNCRLGRLELAKAEILTLLSEVNYEGHLPLVVFRDNNLTTWLTVFFRGYWPKLRISPLVQPPVVALAVKEIWQKSEDKNFLDEALPLLERHFSWLRVQRCVGGSELVSIISPWESGLDHKPAFDSLMGRFAGFPFGLYYVLYTSEMRLARLKFNMKEIEKRHLFNVREVLFNTVYALGLEAIAGIYSSLGSKEKAEYYKGLSAKVEQELFDNLLYQRTGLYYDLNVSTGRLVLDPSVTSLIPIALSSIPYNQQEALIRHIRNTEEFWLPFPIPSVPANHPKFKAEDQRYLWRGPTWINTNWLLCEGLRRHGYHDIADELAEKSRSLVHKSGFREYYNPYNGDGEGEKNFAWSTLAVIM